MVPSTFLLAEDAKDQEVRLVSWRRPQQQGEDVNLAVFPDAEMTTSGGCESWLHQCLSSKAANAQTQPGLQSQSLFLKGRWLTFRLGVLQSQLPEQGPFVLSREKPHVLTWKRLPVPGQQTEASCPATCSSTLAAFWRV